MGDNDKVVALIPKGFRLIARTEQGNIRASIYYNSDSYQFMIALNHHVMGPMTQPELDRLSHVLSDVIDMRGNYFFLE